MNVPLSNILSIAERTLFHCIRRKVVYYGYLPDITLYPDTEQGYLSYNTDIGAVRTDKGFAIEVFGFGSSQSKYLLKVPRIVLVSFGINQGDIGITSNTYVPYTDSQGRTRYTERAVQSITSDLDFEVHMISRSAEESRILQSIVAIALPNLGYIPRYGDSSKYFNIIANSNRTIPILQEGLIEHIVSYTLKDLMEVEPGTIQTNISEIEEIDTDIHLRDMDSENISDADDSLHVE